MENQIKYPIIHPALVQGTPEWHKIRLGKFTGSEFCRLVTKPKAKDALLSEGAKTYCLEVVSERLTGKPAKEEFSNYAMEHGKQWEPIARQTYEALYGTKVDQIGFIDFRPGVGYSPDGLIGTNGSIEIKCPSSNVPHLDFLRMTNLKEESAKYHWQVIGGLLCSGREWIDFVSYSPFYPAELKFKKYRIYAEEVQEEIAFLDEKLQIAEAECQKIITELYEPSTGLLTI